MIDYLSFTDLFDDLILAVIKSWGEKEGITSQSYVQPLEAKPLVVMLG
jgi:hypothetical protein